MPSEKPTTILLYAVAASLAAATLVYIFGPTIFPNDSDVSSKGRAGAVGLLNLANDCFINSVLQALAGLKELKAYLLEHVQQKSNGDRAEHDVDLDSQGLSPKEALLHGTVTKALEQILHQLSEIAQYRKTTSAKGFIRTVEYAYGSMINRRQQDAQEFLQLVTERLADEQRSRLRSQQGNTGVPEEDTKLSALSMTVRTPFEGKTTSTIECQTCHYKPAPSTSVFTMLSLQVPSKSATTIDACLDGLLKVETIDDYRCARCAAIQIITDTKRVAEHKPVTLHPDVRLALGRLETAVASGSQLDLDEFAELAGSHKSSPTASRISKHTFISQYPSIIVLHLSRSLFDVSAASLKNHARVAFPEVLTLGGFDRKAYNLSCLITHRGGHNSGHYETFRRHSATLTTKLKGTKHSKKNKWWRISDDRVSECTTPDVLNMQKEVYLLFYEASGHLDDPY